MKAIIGIGVPGCGKTTLLKPLAMKEGLAYINADDIREELTGDARDHTKELLVWRTAYDRIKEGLESRGSIVDATHSKRKDRLKMIRFCRQHGAQHIIGYWFKTPLEVCTQRNRSRQRIVPVQSIERMHARLEINPPSKEEGFDEVIEITTD